MPDLPLLPPANSTPHGDDVFHVVRAALTVHGDELARYPNVISVRPGYRFRHGQITSQPAITVSVLRKKDVSDLTIRDILPTRLGNVLVDVIPASPGEQLRAAREFSPEQPRLEAAPVVNTLSAERGIVDFRTPLERVADEFVVVGEEAARQPYTPPDPAVLALTEVNELMTLVCHASPDSGWRLLRQFIEATTGELTATMYEFTAPYIKDTLLAALPTPRRFDFVMDFERESTGFDNEQALTDLSQALGDRFTFAWAPVVADRKTTVGFFPTAYHIKVAVRDSQALWLSSGNWKPSGQPETDPFLPPAGFSPSSFQNSQNREWHIIAESPSLARQFKEFIEFDLKTALPLQLPAVQTEAALMAVTQPDLFVTEAVELAEAEALPVQFFRELTLRKKIRIQPLLTPDNFIDFILPLLKRARHRVFFQNQSLKPNPNNAAYTALFNTLRDFSQHPDIDTRLIMRGDFSPHEALQALQQSGVNMDRVRLQKGCHTKGLIIDNLAVVVGSHNWTSQGVTENRDASLIIYDKKAIAYYEKLFLYDWNRIASPSVDSLGPMPLVASEGVPTPVGMRRVSWSDVYD